MIIISSCPDEKIQVQEMQMGMDAENALSKVLPKMQAIRHGQGDKEVKAANCDHYWCYEHAIWQARKDDQSRVVVGRYCGKCGKMQTAIAKDWRPVPASFVDMRKALSASFRKT